MNKEIRILHVTQRLESAGAQTLIMNLYRNIDRTKIQFDFLVEYKKKYFYDDEIIKMGGKIYYSSVRQDFNVVKFKKYLKKIIQENNYQIIHVHADTIGYFCLKLAKKCGVKVRIAHAHNAGINHDFKYLFRRVMLKLYPIYATDLFACSDDAGKYFFGNRYYKIINNAIDTEKFIANDEKRRSIKNELKINNNFVVGHVGRFHPQKNHKFLLDIFKEIKKVKNNAKLLLVGSGPLEDEIKNKIISLGLSNDVIILNNRSDMDRIYQAMDVFVFPSLYEGLPVVLVEVQASGVPVLCSTNVPHESKLIDLYKELSLDVLDHEWAKEAIKISKEKEAHKNMQKYIIERGYDIKKVSKDIQKFYLENYKKFN